MAKKPFPFSVCEECCVAGGGGGGGGEISIDTEMSDTSKNAVQNKVIKKYVDEGLDKKASLESVNSHELDISYLMEQVGNIDSALDNIIEIQNSLIGGDL